MAISQRKEEATPSDEMITQLARLKHLKDPSTPQEDNLVWAKKVCPDTTKRASSYSKLYPDVSREDNLYMAKQDILKGITSGELKDVETRIRGMIQHENELLNHRIQWFLIINGFLLSATASLIAKLTSETAFMLVILAVIGFLVCVSFWFSLGIGRRGVGRLADLWKDYRDLYYHHEEPTGCHQIGVLGWKSNVWATRLAPWYLLPLIFGGVWALLICTHLASKPVPVDTPHQIRIVQINGQVVEIPIKPSKESTTIIQLPEGRVRLDTPKLASQTKTP